MKTATEPRPMSDKEDALAQLRKRIEPGQTVYTVLRHVSASGMTRRIDVYVMEENKPYFVTGLVGKACGYRHEFRKGGLVVSGCGMDMGFEVVYNLGRALWPDGAASAIHRADRAWTKGRNGDQGPETDGGYMLRQEWL